MTLIRPFVFHANGVKYYYLSLYQEANSLIIPFFYAKGGGEAEGAGGCYERDYCASIYVVRRNKT